MDDLVGAHQSGKLQASVGTRFSPCRLGPLIELSGEGSDGRAGPLLRSNWLDQTTQSDLRNALAGDANVWFDPSKLRGFIRGTFSPSEPSHDNARTGFLVAARIAAGNAGFSTAIAQSLTAAMREMESNIHEHSQLSETGLLAFQATPSSFEFVAADCGVGVLSTLQESPDFSYSQRSWPRTPSCFARRSLALRPKCPSRHGISGIVPWSG